MFDVASERPVRAFDPPARMVRESGQSAAVMARKQPSGATQREFRSRIGSGQTVLHYRKKQLMYVQGDPADAIFYVEKGYVKLAVT
jgi:CRP-like cAMP-binding protein